MAEVPKVWGLVGGLQSFKDVKSGVPFVHVQMLKLWEGSKDLCAEQHLMGWGQLTQSVWNVWILMIPFTVFSYAALCAQVCRPCSSWWSISKSGQEPGPIEAEQTYCGLPSHCLRMEHLGKHFANARIKTKLQHQHPLALRVVNQCTLSQNKIPEVWFGDRSSIVAIRRQTYQPCLLFCALRDSCFANNHAERALKLWFSLKHSSVCWSGYFDMQENVRNVSVRDNVHILSDDILVGAQILH